VKNVLLAALLLTLAGCGNVQAGGGDGGEGLAAVQPSRVTESDLRAATSDPRLVRFYEARGWRPAWDAAGAAGLIQALEGAKRHGLDAEALLRSAARSDAPAAREAGLSLAALDYADALARGRVDPTRVREHYAVPRPVVDVAAGLNRALEQGNVGAWLDGLAPQDEEYRRLSEAYVAATAEAGRRLEPIPEGGSIRPGASDPRVPAIAAALRARGYLPAPPQGEDPAQPQAGAGNGYSAEMADAVRRLQEDHGLEPTAIVDAATLASLNQSAVDRARILAVNLERRRWLPREAPANRIDVNIAAASLDYWRDGRIADRRRVVVGQPTNETPELASPIFRLVANPTWTVPESIAEEEILPKGESYLRRNRMVMRDGRIVQESGPQNSLGEVKFDMRNDQAIYLHDTPAKSLFGEAQRHRSHGCVRVHDALGFAAMIAEQEGVADDWREALATGEETFVALPREIPVRLLYHSAFVDGGRIRFAADPYGLDEDVAQALGLAARPRVERPTHVRDIGP
jgi:L,D-transpeptidase YcbB